MRSCGFVILLFALACSRELFAGIVQTSKGTRLSILAPSSAESPKPEALDPSVADKGAKEKAKPGLLAKKGAPKGKVKVRSVASSRAKKADRSAPDVSPVIARK